MSVNRRPGSLVRAHFVAVILLSLTGLALITWQGFLATGEVLREQAELHPSWSRPAADPVSHDAPTPTLKEGLRRIQSRLLATAALSLLAALVLASWLSLRLQRELELLRRGADRIAAGRLEYRLPVERHHAELASLADSVNRMAQALAHEIRRLDDQRAELTALLTGMREGVLALDRKHRVRSCNLASRRLLDLGEHPVGALLEDLLHGRPNVLDALVAGWKGGDQEREVVLEAGPLRELRVWSHVLPTPQGGDPLLLVVVSDLGAINQAERLRREFVANVSHELKTPVTSIRGYVEALLDAGDPGTETWLRFLAVIDRQARRLDAIIDDLLTLTRIERQGEQANASREAVELAALFTRLLEDHQPAAAQAGVNLILDLRPDAPAFVLANPSLLERALTNLIANAIRYGRPGTSIWLRASSAMRKGRRGLQAEVQDQGCGIAAEHLPRIFERFYVVDRARSRALGGTGLGLSIVKHAVTVQEGDVGVESEVDVGSRFWLWLPLDDSHE